MKLAADSGDDKNKNTTLTIVQEFPKKDAKEGNIAGNIEMVQGQEQNTNVHYLSRKSNKNKKTTLTIVQDFPKKKTDQQINSVDLVQGKNAPGDIKIVEESKS